MRFFLPSLLFGCCLLAGFAATGQTQTRVAALLEMSKKDSLESAAGQQRALESAPRKNWPATLHGKKRSFASLTGIGPEGRPIYLSTFNNTIAAASLGTSDLWTGGRSGLGLDGATASLKGKLGIWDGAGVLPTHVELAGRIVQKDQASANSGDGSAHATHVCGTLMAKGVKPAAKGMANGLQEIWAYDFGNDNAEMAAAAANGLLVSNHSYGTICGWYQDTDGSWLFYGDPNQNEDYNFGYYNDAAAKWDAIAYNAPYYLVVKAAGNSRDVNGPAVGKEFFYYDQNGNKQSALRTAALSGNNGYDIIGTTGNAKNILTVGAVNAVPNGYARKEDVVMTSFSSWGPTDDGRIKPDLVADGQNVLSCSSTGDNDYMVESGTSMSTPSIAGSLVLLQEYYARLFNGGFMRSASLKGLAIHTADEAGTNPGPDYKFGWGLMNTGKAAKVIGEAGANNNGPAAKHLLLEKNLSQGETHTYTLVAGSTGKLTATLAWTDPAGSVDATNKLDNPAPKLVNDLDIRVKSGSKLYYPWKLSGGSPSAAAFKGDNTIDNIEKIEIDSAILGQEYVLTVTNKNSLVGNSQAYSLIISGCGGNAYCASTATASGLYIQQFNLSALSQTVSGATCPVYEDFTTYNIGLKPNKSYPLFIRLGTCDGSTANRAVKVFLDYDGDGDFGGAGETVASGLAQGQDFSATIKVSGAATIGSSTRMRVVVADAAVPDTLRSCGSYSKGVTRDYRADFLPNDYDLSVSALSVPGEGTLPLSSQLVTVLVANKGGRSFAGIDLGAVVKNSSGGTTTMTGRYASPIDSAQTVAYTFQQPLYVLPNDTLSISAYLTSTIDENPANDTLKKTLTTDRFAGAVANECQNSVNYSYTNPTGAGIDWYDAATDAKAFSTDAKGSKTARYGQQSLYVGVGQRGRCGLSAKGSGSGGYQSPGNQFMKYTSTKPGILESVKLYTRFPGTVTFYAADITDQNSANYGYNTLASKTIDVYATSPVAEPNSVELNDVADKGAYFNIGLELPAGSHAIIVTTNGASVYRDRQVPSGSYPFKLGDWFSIDGNSAIASNGSSDPNFYKSYYYYLYDMTIRSTDCIGDRIPVPIQRTVFPKITFDGDSLRSNAPQGNQWYLDGKPLAGANGPKFKPTVFNGQYTLTVTDTFQCTKRSVPFYIDHIEPIVAGNPSKGGFEVSFYANEATPLQITLSTVNGKMALKKDYGTVQGNFSTVLATGGLASGVYFMTVNHRSGRSVKKIVVVP